MGDKSSKSRQLHRALRKCRYHDHRTVYAYCTPTEYFLLLQHFQINLKTVDVVELVRAANYKKAGYSNPRPHYLRPRPSILANFREWKNGS